VYALCIFTCACSTRRCEVYLCIYIYLYLYLLCALSFSLSHTQAVLEGTWLLKEESSGTFDVLSCQHTTLVDSAGAVQCVAVYACCSGTLHALASCYITCVDSRGGYTLQLTATHATPCKTLQQGATQCNRVQQRHVGVGVKQGAQLRVGVKQVAQLHNPITLTQLNLTPEY